jgi:hypothetical protein
MRFIVPSEAGKSHFVSAIFRRLWRAYRESPRLRDRGQKTFELRQLGLRLPVSALMQSSHNQVTPTRANTTAVGSGDGKYSLP